MHKMKIKSRKMIKEKLQQELHIPFLFHKITTCLFCIHMHSCVILERRITLIVRNDRSSKSRTLHCLLNVAKFVLCFLFKLNLLQ